MTSAMAQSSQLGVGAAAALAPCTPSLSGNRMVKGGSSRDMASFAGLKASRGVPGSSSVTVVAESVLQRNGLLHKKNAPRTNRRGVFCMAADGGVFRCECYDLFEELVPYVAAWKWQKETVDSMCAAVTRGEEPSNSVILLQHPPVYTMGTRSSDRYLRFDKENPPFELHRTERGGEVTYHGPGQLVMYPILNLRHHNMDLHWYLRMLEEVVIRTLWSACGLQASRIDGLTGVWVGEMKVAAIGVRVSRWITYHGLALNVNTDLAPFQNIVPCGIDDRSVGSIQHLLKAGSMRKDQKNSFPTGNQMFQSILQGVDNGSYKTGITAPAAKAIEKTVWDDAMLLSHVHDALLAEFAEVFHLQLVPPTRDGPKTFCLMSLSQ